MINNNTKEHWNKKHQEQYYIYGSWNYNEIWQSPLSYHKVASDILILNKDSVKRQSFLEIGCAAGFFTSHVKLNLLPSFEVSGWDFSKYGIECAKYTAEHNVFDIYYEERDILQNPVDKEFGFICCFETIEHFEEGTNYKVLDNILDHCEYAIISTVTTKDSCGGEHVSHYDFDTFTQMGYNVLWKAKLSKIDMSATGDYGDYYYVIFLLKGKL